jgi:hypothetical protein
MVRETVAIETRARAATPRMSIFGDALLLGDRFMAGYPRALLQTAYGDETGERKRVEVDMMRVISVGHIGTVAPSTWTS